jgi:uncharacterized repeat protein (TIGR03803 family)
MLSPRPLILLSCYLLFVSSGRGAVLFTNLASFNGTNGSFPAGELIQARDGNFYGTTSEGGAYQDRLGNSLGTLFRLSPNGTLVTLLSFNGTNGANPLGGLVQDSTGILYGTTFYGGTNTDVNFNARIGYGTVFKVTTNGSLTTLFSFFSSDFTNGGNPNPLVFGSDGNLYGTTQGNLGAGAGTVFRITPAGTLTTLATVAGTNGSSLMGTLIEGTNGSFYGTAYSGGSSNLGTVFNVLSNGQLTRIVSFVRTNGGNPRAGLVRGVDGNLYGTTYAGGASNLGTVFRLDAAGTLTTLMSFDNIKGILPAVRLLVGDDGNFYGRTASGPSGPRVFKVTPAGEFTPLYSLNDESSDPFGGLIQGKNGAFYGTTYAGGSQGMGSVFSLSVPMSPVLHAAMPTPGTVQLDWSTVVGQAYQLQYTGDLSANSWTNLGASVLATNRTVSTSDPAGLILNRLYRVRVLP